MDVQRLISARSRGVGASGIRRVFEDASRVPDTDAAKINLSIGQPDFPVPEAIKQRAAWAIAHDRNGYPPTRGIDELRAATAEHLRRDVGWTISEGGPGLVITSGTSGALMLAAMALLDAGDELVIPDPYFVSYPHMATLTGARAVLCDTYPDFRLTAERVERVLTPRTKMVLLNSPGNPAGVVATERECLDLLDLCRRRGVVLLSDEIYDEFTYAEGRTSRFADGSRAACPSPARLAGAEDTVLLVRGFGKTYGVTGWRLGFAAGPAWLIAEMTKLQQYLYVCAPHPLQAAAAEAFRVDMADHVADYSRRRDLVLRELGPFAPIPRPDGAFYAFVEVPPHLGLSASTAATDFYAMARDRKVFVVPGHAFSTRDTHFRLSYATAENKLRAGLAVLAELLRGR